MPSFSHNLSSICLSSAALCLVVLAGTVVSVCSFDILCITVPVISYQYISHSTLPGNSNGHVDTMLIGERLANWKVIFSGSTCWTRVRRKPVIC